MDDSEDMPNATWLMCKGQCLAPLERSWVPGGVDADLRQESPLLPLLNGLLKSTMLWLLQVRHSPRGLRFII